MSQDKDTQHNDIDVDTHNNLDENDIESESIDNGIEGVTFIEPDPSKKMTSAKRKRVEKAKAKVNLAKRRQELFSELSKLMLTEEELPNFKSTTKLGIETDSDNKDIIIVPRKAKPKVIENKEKTTIKEPEKVTKVVVSTDGKKTFGFGFISDKINVVDKNDPSAISNNPKSTEKVLFVNTKKSESSDDSDDVSNEMSTDDNVSNDDLDNEMSVDEDNEESDTTRYIKRQTNRVLSIQQSLVNEIDNKDKELNTELEPKLKINKKISNRIIPVHIPRSHEIKKRRNDLPVLLEESNIIEAVMENNCVVICGETGSGKTTQVPQMLYEIGFSNPESEFNGMIAVTQPRRIAATAMATRVAEEMGELGNQVAHQIRYDSSVSESTRIKFMTDGILLREAQSDVLLSKYSCIIIDEAHERSINTDVLIGLLSRIVPLRNKRGPPLRLIIMSATLRVSEFAENAKLFPNPPTVIKVGSRQYNVRSYFSKKTEVDDYCGAAIKKVCKIHNALPPGGILVFLTGHKEIEDVCQRLRGTKGNEKLHVIPLYSSLDPSLQNKVFEEPPENHRLCVIATNVAETSLTIPNIRYVVDSGRSKQRKYDVQTGVSAFVIDWISKASSEQRAGRAGRTCEGYCYKLYSSAVYNDTFPEFSEPEVKRMPLESVVLSLKSMGIDKVVNFPFPSNLSLDGLKKATKLLQTIGLLDDKENISPIGLQVSEYPLHPRLAKVLYLSKEQNILEIGLTLVSALSVNDVYLDTKVDRSLFINKDSDLLSLVIMVDAFRIAQHFKGVTIQAYCSQYAIKRQAFQEILMLRDQLCVLLNVDKVPPKRLPNPEEQITTRKIIAQCFTDNIARLVRKEELGKYIRSGLRHAYITMQCKEPVVIHNTSCLHGGLPDYVVFHEIIEFNYKTMRGVTRVNYKWVEDASKDFIQSFEKRTFN